MSTLPPPLRGSNKDCFAYETLRDRVPVILTKALDGMTRWAHQQTDQQEKDRAKAATGRLSELKYQLQTNKAILPIEKFHPESGNLDKHKGTVACMDKLRVISNEAITKYGSNEDGSIQGWLDAPWLLAECVLYLRVQQAMSDWPVGTGPDVFALSKNQAKDSALEHLEVLIAGLKDETEMDGFKARAHLCLWGNGLDLSLLPDLYSSGDGMDLHKFLNKNEEHLLQDDLAEAHKVLQMAGSAEKVVEISLDNVGIELAADLLLTHWLISERKCKRVVLWAKVFPYFVSDATEYDIVNFIDRMASMDAQSHPDTIKIGQELQTFLKDGSLEIAVHPFFTSPYPFQDLHIVAPDVADLFKERSLLVILKGDLNGRKLLGDLDWDPTTPMSTVREAQNILPNGPPILSLRTLKADTVAGLSAEVVAKVKSTQPLWMVSGENGNILFC
eukprot:Clim_evm10s78 gene=Clim_evmTU10s78